MAHFISWVVVLTAIAAVLARSAPADVSRRTAAVKVFEHVAPSVVNIATKRVITQRLSPFGRFANDPFAEEFFRDFFVPRYRRIPQSTLGSGVVIDDQNHILTNEHVVLRGSDIIISLADGRQLEARVMGTHHRLDLAVLQVESDERLPNVTLGDSDDIMIGEDVIAIGNPFGYSHTISRGIVSALHRNIKVDKMVYRDLIQTDAAINPGNSGGPLLNIHGELIGINQSVRSRAEGIGFAIPINRAKRVVEGLIRYGAVHMAWIGLNVDSLTDDTRRALEYHNSGGVVVSRVWAQSPAARAGVQAGDIITAVDTHAVSNRDAYLDFMRDHTIGDTIALTVIRQKTPRVLRVTGAKFPRARAAAFIRDTIGFEVTESNTRSGQTALRVSKVHPGSDAAEVGLAKGDLIVRLNDRDLSSLDDFRDAVAVAWALDDIVFLVQRGRIGYYVTFSL